MPTTVLTYSVLQKRLWIANSAISYMTKQIIRNEDKGIGQSINKDKLLKLQACVNSLWDYASVPVATAAMWYIPMNLNSLCITFSARVMYNGTTIFNATTPWMGSQAATASNLAALITGQTSWPVTYTTAGVFVYAPAVGASYNAAIGYTATQTQYGNTSTTTQFSGGVDNGNTPFDDTNTTLKVNDLSIILDKMCELYQGVPVSTLLTYS